LGAFPLLTATQPLQQEAMTLESMRPSPIDHQKQCELDAREHFRQLGWDNDPLARFTQHYNKRLKRCVIVIDTVLANTEAGVVVTHQLGDTHGRDYAAFISIGPPSAASARDSSLMCEITMSSGDAVECGSFAEFEEFVRAYMK
jgi:hypothetical protein